MNRQYAEKIISALKDDLENDYKGFELASDMSRAEKLFGRDIPAICDCVEEAKRYSGTIRSNAQTIIDLLEMELLEQVGTSMTQVERGLFIKLFNRGGYVLDFSTNDFDTFTMESVGVAICSKYKMSKGRSLLAYIEGAKNSETDKLLHDLFDYYETHYESEYTKDFQSDDEMSFSYTFHPPYNEDYSRLYAKCKEIAGRVFPNRLVPLAAIADNLKEQFSSEYLNAQINAMLSMAESNPTEAIGKAKELIESCCKTILNSRKIAWDKNWDVGQLTGETLKILKLMPKNIPEDAPAAIEMKALLGNLRAITTNVAALRNHYGSGHGKSADYKGLSPRHAKLAVGSSITLVEFLWETHLDRPQGK